MSLLILGGDEGDPRVPTHPLISPRPYRQVSSPKDGEPKMIVLNGRYQRGYIR
jgi:hypothetical protein